MQGPAGMKSITIFFLITGQMVVSALHPDDRVWVCVLHGQEPSEGNYTIRGAIEDATLGMIYLAEFYGDRFILRDSIESISGSFYFLLDDTCPAGVYRILFSQVTDGIMTGNRFVEFIFNREDLELLVTSEEQGTVPVFGNSPENTVYSEFLEFEIGYEDRIMELYGQLAAGKTGGQLDSGPTAGQLGSGRAAGRTDSGRAGGRPEPTQAAGEYDALQTRRAKYIDSITALHPELYATRIIRAFRSPLIPGSMSHRDRIDTLRVCFFNHSAIDDPALMHAPVYTFRILDFLSLFLEKELSRDRQQQLYLEAVDRIMVNTSTDTELRSFVVEFLLEGFEMLGMESVQAHLAENYLDETCASDTGAVVRSRMACYRELGPGDRAPDFVIRDIQGVNHHLSGLDHPYVLVMFWSSGCEHCRELLPELHEWYLHDNSPGMEILAISIDTLEAPFRETMRGLEPEWITGRDPLGWIGKVPTDYCIYATPSMFLMDSSRTILAKPLNFRQFLRAVRRIQ